VHSEGIPDCGALGAPLKFNDCLPEILKSSAFKTKILKGTFSFTEEIVS
jgi:hypothetical protein